MKLRKTLLRSAPLACATLLASMSANAVPPHLPDLVTGGNMWTITFWQDNSPQQVQWATQRICFFRTVVAGTHQRYVWVSVSFPDWNGRATQEGDQIFMHGDFQFPPGKPDVGHDGMQWEIVTATPRNLGAGHWHEWIEDGRAGLTIEFGNATFNRVGQCQFATADEALDANREIPRPRDDSGKELDSPMGVGQATTQTQ
ncbi:MAG TPA: hypothetical protein VFU13_06320 [Steroidobacteraceae bacterium]|nr:hypothetical protein [Steroidobacteraceae bacterium]